ncbi:MAG: hypothetical protein L3J75_05235 [Methylococcaceae bacterium]|nr:hypothetical protein [Methylococcaceae bacterium]
MKIINPILFLTAYWKDFAQAWRNFGKLHEIMAIFIVTIVMMSSAWLYNELNDMVFNPVLTLEEMEKTEGNLLRFKPARRGSSYYLYLETKEGERSFRFNMNNKQFSYLKSNIGQKFTE